MWTESSNTLLAEWGKIVGYNLRAVCLLVLVNLILWFDLFPLGYVTVFGNLTLYSIFIGTNSFAISIPERMAPSFAIFARFGPYEMIGFLLVAAATFTNSLPQNTLQIMGALALIFVVVGLNLKKRVKNSRSFGKFQINFIEKY